MRWLPTLALSGTIVGTAAAQGFAPAQPRAAEPPEPPSRLAVPMTRTDRPEATIARDGRPLPAPLGLGTDDSNEVRSARVQAFGAEVRLPATAAGTGSVLGTFTDGDGNRSSVLYNPSTALAVVYDQRTSFRMPGRSDRRRRDVTPSIATRPGQGSSDGIINNPTFSLRPRDAARQSGLPALNPARPTYSHRSDLGLPSTSRTSGLGATSAGSSPGVSSGGGSFRIGSP